MEYIYGIDTSKPITPIQVRDAIIQCFLEAHKEILDQFKEIEDMGEQELTKMEKLDVELTVKNFFAETNGDFDKPTKDSLMKVMEKLKEFASNFRNPEIIAKHVSQIMELVDKL